MFCDHTSRREAPTTTLWPSAHRLAVGPHAIVMIVIAPWIRAYQGGELFRHNRPAAAVLPHGSGVSPTTWTGGQGSIRRNKAQQAPAPRDEVAQPCRPPFEEFGMKAPSRPPCGIGTMDLRPSTIAARCGSTVCRIAEWKNLRAAENAL